MCWSNFDFYRSLGTKLKPTRSIDLNLTAEGTDDEILALTRLNTIPLSFPRSLIPRVTMSKSGARAKDRISALPDELLSRIFSFLETKYAVRTTILSLRWKNFWTKSLPDLWFCYYDGNNEDAFMTYVDRVLFFRDSSDIKLFRLELPDQYGYDDYKRFDFSRFESWICTAIRRNVVELDLVIDFYPYKTFELPPSLFTSKTLEVLKLRSNFIANPPKSGCFPNLKILHVIVHYADHGNSSLGQIFSNCPVLEDLSIEGTLWEAVLDFNISTPVLKTLTIKLYVENNLYGDDDGYNFYIKAPKLEVFNITYGDSSLFSFEIDAKSLLKANIGLRRCYRDYESTNGLLEAISNVKQLSLSTHCLEDGVPAFDNLNHLELTLDDFTHCRYLMEFLKRSRNLEYLVIKNNFKGEHEDFSPPEVVPVCMLSHLKTITISSFKGRRDEMRVAQYLLRYSEVLNKMTIFLISDDLLRAKAEDLFKEFLMFERGSKTCQVEICN